MKVLYVGAFQSGSPGEAEIAAALEELGHEVVRLDERDTNVEEIEGRLLAEPFAYFLFSKLRVPGDRDRLIRECPVPTVCWLFDLFWNLQDETV